MIICSLIPILAACGGGGNASGSTPVIPVGNTSLSHYLPLSVGNTWLFSSGGRINDSSTGVLSCTCTYNGGQIEGHDIISPTGAYSGTFYYAKQAGAVGSGAPVTFLVGSSTNHGATLVLVGSTATANGTIPGIGVIDDNPYVGESFSDPIGDASTITAVGQTANYSTVQYVNVATDTLSGPSVGPAGVLWSFARGVGYTSLSLAGVNATLTSFTASSTSSARMRRPVSVVEPTTMSRENVRDILSGLL
jgi:hypothetical protein